MSLPGNDSSRKHAHSDGTSRIRERFEPVPKNKNGLHLQTVSVYLVECRGIEPLTSRVRF